MAFDYFSINEVSFCTALKMFWYSFFFLLPFPFGFILCGHTIEILNVGAPQ